MKNHTKKQVNRLQGTISISAKGAGYVAIGTGKDKERDPEIDFKHLNTALHGDTVEIILHPKNKGRQTAEVSKIISRAKTAFRRHIGTGKWHFFSQTRRSENVHRYFNSQRKFKRRKIGTKSFCRNYFMA